MRGLTDAEAEALRAQLDTLDLESPDGAGSPEPGPDRSVLLEGLVARGLLREEMTEWVPDPDDPGMECTFAIWEVTRLGRIALACHAAAAMLSA